MTFQDFLDVCEKVDLSDGSTASLIPGLAKFCQKLAEDKKIDVDSEKLSVKQEGKSYFVLENEEKKLSFT